MPEGGAFPEGRFSLASFHQGGNLLAVAAAGNLQKQLPDVSCVNVGAGARPPESVVCTRFLPAAEFFLAAVAAYLLRRDQLLLL